MATHSSILALDIPQTEGSCRLQSLGSQESDMTERLNNNNYRKTRGLGFREANWKTALALSEWVLGTHLTLKTIP